MSMSVQVDHRRESNNHDPLKSPKKRKHTSSSKEPLTKKRRKNPDDEGEQPEPEASLASKTPTREKRKQKKHIKRENNEDQSLDEHQPTLQDIELPDASPMNLKSSESVDLPDLDQNTVREDAELRGLFESDAPSSFYSSRISLYVPVPALSLESGIPSILSKHLAPLLLTYFPPAKGIILAFSDPVLSGKCDTTVNVPLLPPYSGTLLQQEGDICARVADEGGVSWVWLTATFLSFRPDRRDEIYGWTNAVGDGLIGLVSYNYFQTAVGKDRIPKEWSWQDSRAGLRKGKKGKIRDDGHFRRGRKSMAEENTEDERVPDTQGDLTDDNACYLDHKGSKIPETLKFRVVDIEVIPDKEKWSLQIYGTLLSEEAEERMRDEERMKFDRTQRRSRSRTPGDGEDRGRMSGGLGVSRGGSVVSN